MCLAGLLAPGESSTSDQYTKYWEKQEAGRANGKNSMKEEKTNNQTFFGKKDATGIYNGAAPKVIAQTRYMPLEVEERDDVQKGLMAGVGPMLIGGHGDDLVRRLERREVRDADARRPAAQRLHGRRLRRQRRRGRSPL